MSNETKDTIEQIIDKVGISGICLLISEICNEKAQHVRENWQDENLARDWNHDARVIDKITGKLYN